MALRGQLDVKRLKILRQAGREESFTRAAEVLGYSPSAISQQMSALERDVGVVLFERGARGVRLTDAGRALCAHADAVLERIAEAESELEGIAGLKGGELRFGSFTSATAAFAAAAVETFRAAHPAVRVRFVDGEPYESVARLAAGELDLALVFDFEHWGPEKTYDGVRLGADDGVKLLPLFDDPFVLLVPRGHRLAGRERVAVRDLAGEAVVGGPPWTGELEHLCRLAGVEVRIDEQQKATGFEAFQAFVAAGRGVTLLPRLAIGWRKENLVMVQLDDGPVRHVKAALLSRTYHSPAVLAMLEVVRGKVAETIGPVGRAPRRSTVAEGARPPARVFTASAGVPSTFG